MGDLKNVSGQRDLAGLVQGQQLGLYLGGIPVEASNMSVDVTGK